MIRLAGRDQSLFRAEATALRAEGEGILILRLRTVPPPLPLESRVRELVADILHDIADGVIAQGLDGTLLYANDAAAHMIGYPNVQELRAEPLAAILQHFEITNDADEPMDVSEYPDRTALGTGQSASLRSSCVTSRPAAAKCTGQWRSPCQSWTRGH